MTTFRKTPVKSEISGDNPLSDYALGYLNERVRNSFYDYVLRRFHEAAEREGLTKAKLARRLRIAPARVTRLLGAPGNWTLDTVSELLIGICREELRPQSESYLERAPRNFQSTDLLMSLPVTQKKGGVRCEYGTIMQQTHSRGSLTAKEVGVRQGQSAMPSGIARSLS